MYSNAENDKDIKSLFRITKEQLGWERGGPPTSLVVEGKNYNKPTEIAEIMSKIC